MKAVIFDMDGVIIDSEPLHKDIGKDIFKELGLNISDEEYNTYIGTTSYYMWNDIKNKYDLKNGLEDLVRNERDIYLKHLKANKDSVNPIEGVTKLIKELHENGIKLAVASSSPIKVIETVIEIFNLNSYFDFLITGDSVKNSKPEPDIFLYAAEKLDVSPKQCIVIEDSCNGTKAAKKAEMKCVGYKNLNSGIQDLSRADKIVDSFLDINYKKLLEL